jgi:hypothetical protein
MVLFETFSGHSGGSSQPWGPKKKEKGLSDQSQGRGCSRDALEICARVHIATVRT